MGNNSDDVAEGILKALWALALGFVAFSFVTHHPVLIGVSLLLFVIFFILSCTYKYMKRFFGKGIDLFLAVAFAGLGWYIWKHDGEGDPSTYNWLAVIGGWVAIILAMVFFNGFRNPNHTSED